MITDYIMKRFTRFSLRSLFGRRKREKDRKQELYEKVLRHMETEHPYLDPDLTIAEVAVAVLSNRAAVSSVINDCSGKNFCQFVNTYRIAHCVKLLCANPDVHVREIAAMSGFSNEVTFNTAFKQNVGTTPGKYIRCLKINQFRLPSMMPGQERSRSYQS